MKYSLIGAGLIITAIAFELAGLGNGGCELWFRIRLRRARKSRREAAALHGRLRSGSIVLCKRPVKIAR